MTAVKSTDNFVSIFVLFVCCTNAISTSVNINKKIIKVKRLVLITFDERCLLRISHQLINIMFSFVLQFNELCQYEFVYFYSEDVLHTFFIII